MRYMIVFNGRRGYERDEIYVKTWSEFIDTLNRLVEIYHQPSDMIYLIEGPH